MNINERVKELRISFGLNQEEFGNKIGLSKSGISNIESGTRNVTDKHIKLICGEFCIKEEWLRYGVGEMKIKTPLDIMEQLKKEFCLDDFSYSLVYEYLKLSQEKRQAVRDFFYCVIDSEENNDYLSNIPKTPEELEKKYPPVEPTQNTDAG